MKTETVTHLSPYYELPKYEKEMNTEFKIRVDVISNHDSTISSYAVFKYKFIPSELLTFIKEGDGINGYSQPL